MRDRKGMDLDRREGGRNREEWGRGETVVRIYCVRKEFMFNKRKKKRDKIK